MHRRSISISLLILTFCIVTSSHAQESLRVHWPRQGGPITLISTEPFDTGGVDIKDPLGRLSSGPSADPFQFFVAGGPDRQNQTQVTLGNLGFNTTVDGALTLPVSVTEAEVCDIAIDFGGGIPPIAVPGPTWCIPEPNANLLAIVMFAGTLAIRKRRSSL